MDDLRYQITGSYGMLIVDDIGKVVECRDNADATDEDNYRDIARVDVDEYAKHYGQMESTDILDIGYWNADGLYEPPEPDFRTTVAADTKKS